MVQTVFAKRHRGSELRGQGSRDAELNKCMIFISLCLFFCFGGSGLHLSLPREIILHLNVVDKVMRQDRPLRPVFGCTIFFTCGKKI